MNPLFPTVCLFAAAALAGSTHAADSDWPMWGRTPARNMTGVAQNLPTDIDAGKIDPATGAVDPATTRNIRWVATLGSQTYGNPTVGGGRVYIGTNNEATPDPALDGDRSLVMAFDQKTGETLWSLPIPKLGSGKVSDWEYLGICSSPHYADEKLYLVTNRCEVIALDAAGMANGNAGDQDEREYLAAEGQPPVTPEKPELLGDVLWRFNMIDECGVFPHNIASSSVLLHDGKIFATTSNGMDWSHVNIPAPNAPAMVVLDREGELIAEEASGISSRLLHANWSSPSLARVGDKDQVLFGAGDGFLYGFSPTPVDGPEGWPILEEIWRVDCNPAEYRTDENGKPIRYILYEGPSEIIATPVVHDGLVYVAIGQDPEHGEGLGHLVCVDPKGAKGDVTESHIKWGYRDIGRSISSVSIQDGLLYIGEYNGRVHCLDAKTGEPYWVHDTGSVIWGSTLVADGKVFIGNEAGELTILEAGKEEKVIAKVEMGAPIYASPIVDDHVLYVATQTHLYAIAADDKP